MQICKLAVSAGVICFLARLCVPGHPCIPAAYPQRSREVAVSSLPGAARLVSHLWRTSLGRVRSLEGEPKLTSPQLDGLARKCITKWSTMDGTQARASPVVAWVTACDNGASMSYQDGGFMPRV